MKEMGSTISFGSISSSSPSGIIDKPMEVSSLIFDLGTTSSTLSPRLSGTVPVVSLAMRPVKTWPPTVSIR